MLKRSVFLGFFVLGQSLSANSEPLSCAAESEDCVPVGKWEVSIAIGAGVRTNPVLSSDDIPIYFVPGVSYYGERFFINDTSFGYTLFESDTHVFNLFATLSFDQVYFDRWNIRNFTLNDQGVALDGGGFIPDNMSGSNDENNETPGSDVNFEIDVDQIDDRNLALLSGIEYYYYTDSVFFNIQAIRDVSSVHNGSELRIAASYPWRFDKNHFEITFGGVWQSDRVVDYYYGLDSNEVPDSRLVYEASNTFSPVIKFDYKRKLSDHWSIYFFAHNKWFGDEITNSPLIDQNTSTTVFLGGVYHF